MADEHFLVKTILGNGRWEGMFARTERMVSCCVERCVRFAWRNKGGGELCRSSHAVRRIRTKMFGGLHMSAGLVVMRRRAWTGV